MKKKRTAPRTADYIDRLINKSLDSDRSFLYDKDLAQALGVSPAALSLYRQGGNMSAIVAAKIAMLLGLHPLETIAATMYHQAKTTSDRLFWLEYYETYRSKTE